MANVNSSSFSNASSTKSASQCAVEEDTMGVMVVKALAYCIVILLSFVGNGLVLHTFYKNRAIRTTTNAFIVNMAASDIMLPVFVIPRHMAAVFEKGPVALNIWHIHGFVGEVLCKLVPFIGDVSNSVSILTLVLISIDRYIAIVWPLTTKYRITPSRCNVLIASTWVVSLALHAHYLYTFKLYSAGEENLCIYNWASVDLLNKPSSLQLNLSAQRIYFLVLFVLIYLIPLITITILYSSIIHELRSKKKILSERNQPSHHRRQRRREDNRVIAMLVVIVSIFAICFAPTHITHFILIIVRNYAFCGSKALFFSNYFLTLSNCCLNPYIYFIFIRRYRQCAKDVLKKLCGSRITNACSKIRDWRSHGSPRHLDSDRGDDYCRTRRANSSSCRVRQTELIQLASEQEPTLQFETGV